MDPTRETLSSAGASRAPGVWGELIVHNGRHAGKSQPLEAPLILVGRSSSCDIRLKSTAVAPLHCALVFSSAGVTLRKLHSRGGISVNGEAPQPRYLRDGDLLAFGPFEFRIHLIPVVAAPVSADPPPAPDDALRIQAAAVVAQQAALTDEEIRLQQRRVALEHQEAQLASHLEEKRRRIIELRTQTRDARSELKADRTRQEEELAAVARDLETLRVELADGQQHLHDERVRLLRLRQRLRQRLHRHWMAERTALKRREQALDAQRADQEKTQERLHAERQEIYHIRLHLNGEAELSKRRLRDAWSQLDRERCHWEEQRARAQPELQARAREVEQRAIDLTDAEKALTEERRRWEQRRLQLEKEAEGLEARIRNQRHKLLEQAEALRRLQAGAAHSPEAPNAPEAAAEPKQPQREELEERRVVESRLAELDRLAGELADQRLYLAEQCQRLNLARKQWQEERDAAAAELEPLALELQQREQEVGARERGVAELELSLRQRQEDLKHQQHSLDAWQARLAVRTALWEGEREHLLAETRSREEKAERMAAAIAQIRRRWQHRRSQEVERIHAMLAACEQLRRDCMALRDDWLNRGKTLEHERRALAERALALEEYRFTFVRQAEDKAVVHQRLDQLRKRWHAEFDAAEQPAIRERQNLAREGEALRERYQNIAEEITSLAQRETELTQREMAHDQEQLQSQAEQDEIQHALASMRARAAIHERQLQDLNNEVERLARAMLDEGDSGMPAARAA
jgi:hypothetical protein